MNRRSTVEHDIDRTVIALSASCGQQSGLLTEPLYLSPSLAGVRLLVILVL